ncbi:MAG: hypothetical protein M9894_25295 [Planctomycetes bacterium]|nr:hypothetical protein [Planctomycetota bacterium]
MDPADVARALGAEPVGRVDARAIPSMDGLHRELAERLRSTGGRPALEGATRRQKIPLTDADWNELERLSERLDATPGQIASVLLHQVLANLDVEQAATLLKKKA